VPFPLLSSNLPDKIRGGGRFFSVQLLLPEIEKKEGSRAALPLSLFLLPLRVGSNFLLSFFSVQMGYPPPPPLFFFCLFSCLRADQPRPFLLSLSRFSLCIFSPGDLAVALLASPSASY